MARGYRYNSDTLWRLHQIGGADLALRYVELSDEAAEREERKERERPGEPSLRSLCFYRGPSQAPEISQRQFASSFPRSKTQFVYFQIELENPWRYVSWHYKLRARYFNPDGTSGGEIEDECVTQPGTATFSHSRGLGWEQPGRWPVGVHRVEILLDGKSIATGAFTIDEDQPLKPWRRTAFGFLDDLVQT